MTLASDDSRPLCLHCERSPQRHKGYKRGLCYRCYHTPAVRQQYPRLKFRSVEDINGGRPLPETPTAARPGSVEKVHALLMRARLRQQLWHPADAPMDSEVDGPKAA